MTTPLTLEWDEDGLHLTLDLTALDDMLIEPYAVGHQSEAEKVRGRLSTSDALDLYEHVRKQLGEWYSEAAAARSAVAAGVTLAEYAEGLDPPDDLLLDPSDPKHPGYAENLAALGDARRKERRENP